jgi:hypothetical protein
VSAGRTLSVALFLALAAVTADLALARWAVRDLADIAWEHRREEALDRRLAVTGRVGEAKARVVNELVTGPRADRRLRPGGWCGWRCGKLLFFGDPEMIRRIKAAVR